MLGATVREAARRFGDAPAIVAPDGWSLSYRDLDRCSDRVAAGLADRGIRAGDVVAVWLPSSPDHVAAYVAVAKLGAITVGVNSRYTAAEGARVLEQLRPRLLVGSEERATVARGDVDTVAVEPASGPHGVLRPLRGRGRPPSLEPDPERPVAIVLTSGTTGDPRGAVFSTRQLAAIVEMDAGPGWGGGWPMLASTELAHVGFATKLVWYLRRGLTIHLLRRWRPGPALEVIARERIPYLGGIAAQIALLLRHPSIDALDVSCVERIVVGGGPSPQEVIVAARERFGAPYSVRYSSTESGGVGTATAFDAPDEEVLHTAGRPRVGVELEIRGDDGGQLGEDEVGEVWLRSPAVMSGYWRDPEATAETLVDGWLRTGDLGLVDDRGCLRLTGRASDAYIRGGYTVHPAEVEAVLREHPDIAGVAVVARPDEVMGEIGVAVVVPADPRRRVALDALRAHAARRLAAYKLPEALRVVDELPLTTMHKVDRRALADTEAATDRR